MKGYVSFIFQYKSQIFVDDFDSDSSGRSVNKLFNLNSLTFKEESFLSLLLFFNVHSGIRIFFFFFGPN